MFSRSLLHDVVGVANEAGLDEPAARARQLLRRLDALVQWRRARRTSNPHESSTEIHTFGWWWLWWGVRG